MYKGRRFAEHGILDIKSYIKPTNSFQYLERNSAHNPSVFKAIIKGETIRHLRNTSDFNIFNETIRTFKSHLIKRGYKSDEIDNISEEVVKQHKTRENILSVKSKTNKRDIPLVFVTKYNPSINKIKQKLLKYWNIIQNDEDCSEIFKNQPIVAYSRHKNLGDVLTNSILK